MVGNLATLTTHNTPLQIASSDCSDALLDNKQALELRSIICPIAPTNSDILGLSVDLRAGLISCPQRDDTTSWHSFPAG